MTDIQQLRLLIGDTTEPYILTDDQLQYYLDINNGNIILTANALRPVVLMQLSTTQVREREGSVEVYGGEKATNYLAALKYFEQSGSVDFKNTASPIVGGVRVSENYRVDSDPDSCGAGITIGIFSQ